MVRCLEDLRSASDIARYRPGLSTNVFPQVIPASSASLVDEVRYTYRRTVAQLIDPRTPHPKSFQVSCSSYKY